ncbi:uncharacterized protein L3040_002742 [Drepanopeziza brunnea f. sp. 'multigermtubi']|uniref:uncharacterized protein n=1 Tax=Drepanopeziza brunnea f. sp. 'multigermtubi' TaxID=698441 RepID=UPI00238B3F98|nr:hypothetical protein L3040_002742 [Drepanopeziza brunnea f. sp. 'multigermtubi']
MPSFTLTALLVSALAFSNPAVAQSPLQSCLAAASIPSTFADSADWAEDISPWQLRIRPTPAGVIKPTSVDQIAAALRCAAAAGVPVAAKNGGHSYGSYGVGGNDGALVIYMDAFQSTSFDAATGLLTFGGGSIVGDVVTWAWQNHGVHFPHVRANRVGLAGSTIGAGFGSTSRFLGTPMYMLTSVEVMLYNSTIVTASKTQNPDLFWVVQGAASSYGIVLSLTTRTWKPVHQTVTNYTITLPDASLDAGVKALLSIQDYYLSGECPDELSLRWSLTAPPFSGTGFYYGSPADFEAIMAPLMARLPANTTLVSATADFWTMEKAATPLIDEKIEFFPPRNFYLQALVLREDQPFTYESAFALYNATTFAFNRTDMTKFGFIDLWGASSRKVKDADSAFAYAKSLFLIRWEGRLAAGLTDFPADGISYMQNGLKPFEQQLATEGVPLRGFVNYRDTELTEAQWSERLFAGNWPRVLRIKKEIDPTGMFTTNPQSIPKQ